MTERSQPIDKDAVVERIERTLCATLPLGGPVTNEHISDAARAIAAMPTEQTNKLDEAVEEFVEAAKYLRDHIGSAHPPVMVWVEKP